MGRRPDGPRRTPGRVLLLLGVLVALGVSGALWIALAPVPPGGSGGAGGGDDPAAATGTGEGAGSGAGGGAHGTHRPVKTGPGPAVAGFGQVRGQVRLFKTREPVAGLALTLKQPEGDALTAATDASGEFAFRQVPAGSGWELRGQQGKYAPIEVTGLDLAPDQTLDVGVLWLAVPVDLPAVVVDTNGKAIEGAEVAAFAMGRTLPEAEDEWSAELREQRTLALVATPRPSRTAKTDAQGRTVVAGLMPGAYRAVASAAGFAQASRSNLLLVPDAKVEPVRFVLGLGHTLEGTVTDEAGLPVAKARVIAALRQGWLPTLDKAGGDTGADGAYRIEGLAAGAYFVYLAREGRPLLQVGQVGIPETARFDVRLRPGGTIQGHVTSEDGKPVADAEIHASMQNTWSPMAARTDKEGAFELKDVPAGPLGYFRVTAQGFIPFPDPAARQQGQGESLREGQVMVRDVTLRRGRTATFTVVGEGKGPLEGVVVRMNLAAMWGSDLQPWQATSNAQGRADVTGLLPGEYLVTVAAEGWVQAGLPRQWKGTLGTPSAFPEAWHVSVPPDGTVEREIRLTRGAAVRGRVFEPSGAPAAGAVVSIEDVRREFPVFSGGDGNFTIDTVPAMRRAVVAAKTSGGMSGTSEPFAVLEKEGADHVEVHLKEPGRVTGSVRTRDGRAPAGAVVRWVPGDVSGGNWWAWRQIEGAERYPVSPEGAFEIPDAPAGRITVRADAEGALPAYESVTVTPGVETGGVLLLLDAPRTIRGRAQSQQGAPVAGAAVTANWAGGGRGDRDGFTPGFSGQPTAQTDADGRFALEGLAQGRYQIWASAPGFAGGAHADTTTEAGEVLLTFAPGKSVTGTVKDPEGNPLVGVPVMAERADGQQNRGGWWWWGQTAYTAPDGTFELQDLAEGNYRLKVSGAWQWGREVNVEDTVREGVAAGDQGVEIVVKRGLVIEGHLLDREKKPVRVGWISAQYRFEGGQYQWGTERWVQVAPDGAFRVAGLRPGPYNLSAYGSFKPKQVPSVAAGTTGVEVQVEDAWVISGVLLDEKGLSVPQFEVQAKKEGADDWDWVDVVQPGDGEFIVTGLEEARYDLQFTVEGYAPTIAKDTAAGRRDLTVRIVKGLDIAGVVVNGSGNPIEQAWVGVQSIGAADGAPTISQGVQTDAMGRFRVTGLVPGQYLVQVRANELAPTILRGVAAGKDDLRIALVPGVSVTGTVVDADGLPLARVSVMLWDEDVRVAAGRSDDEGKFEIRNVPDGGKWKLGVQGRVGGGWINKRLEQTVDSGASDVRVEVK